MSFSSGSFTLASGNPVVTGTTISSTWANNTLSDIASGLSTCLLKDGSQTVTANIPMAGFKFTGLAAGSANGNSLSYEQLFDANGYPFVGTIALTGVAGTNTITGTASPVPSAYAAGQKFAFVPANSNTGAATLNVSSIGAKSIFLNGSALVGYELRKNCPVEVYYDGTQFNIVAGAHGGDGVPIAVIKDRGFGTAANGYLACDGSAVSRTTYADLFAVVGTTWGAGDGATTFNVPPPGRVLVGSGTATTTETISSVTASGNAVAVAANNTKWITGMPVTVTGASGFTGLVNGSYFIIRASSSTVQFATTLANAQNGTAMSVSGTGSATLTTTWTARSVGETGGEESHALSITELVAHTHTLASQITSTGTGATPANLAVSGSSSTGSTGGNAAMNNMQLYAVVLKMIKV